MEVVYSRNIVLQVSSYLHKKPVGGVFLLVLAVQCSCDEDTDEGTNKRGNDVDDFKIGIHCSPVGFEWWMRQFSRSAEYLLGLSSRWT